MKKFYIGYYNRIDLNNAIKKAVGIPNLIFLIGALLFVLIPVLLKDEIFSKKTDMSNVVFVRRDLGTHLITGSAVYVGVNNHYLITAAHVVHGMEKGETCDIEFFQDPNNMDNKICAKARLEHKGNWDPQIDEFNSKNAGEDYALLAVINFDVKKYSKPCQIATNLASVTVSDKISLEGYPGGAYFKTDGTINNVNGGAHKDPNFFVVSAGAWHGSSGGALLDEHNNLLGILTSGGIVVGENAGQNFVLKIDHVLNKLKQHGFVIN